MAKEIGKLYVSLTVDLSKYTKGLRNASAKLGAVSKKFMKAGMVMSAAAAPMIIAFTKMTQSAIQYGERTDKMVKSIGMTAEAWTRLAYAAEQEHTNQEVLAKGLMQLSKNMGYAKDGLATYLREFDRMGIKVTDAQGNLRDVQDVFMEMSDWMTNETIPNTQKVATGMTLLGRAGKEAIPFMKLGRDKLKELGDEAERLGIVLDDKTAAAFKTVSDGITKAKFAFKGIAITIGKELMPVINRVTATIAVLIERFQKLSPRLKKIITIAAIAAPAILGIAGALTMAAGAAGMALTGFLALTAAHPVFVGALGTALVSVAALVVVLWALHRILKKAEQDTIDLTRAQMTQAAAEHVVKWNKQLKDARQELRELEKQGVTTGEEHERLTRRVGYLTKSIQNMTGSTQKVTESLGTAKGIFGIFGGMIDEIKGKAQDLAKALGPPEEDGTGPSVTGSLKRVKGELRGLGDEAAPSLERVKLAFGEISASLTTDAEEIQTGFITAFAYMGNLGVKVADQLNSAISSMATGLVNSMFGVAVNWGNIFKSILKSFATMIAQMIIKAMALQAISFMFPGFGAILGAIPKAQHGLVVPGFPGRPQLVMAHGQEVIMNPNQVDRLIAGVKEAASGGGQTTIYALDSQSFQEFARRELPEVIRVLKEEGRIE